MLPDLDKATLADLGVTAVGDQLAILRSAKDASLDLESVTPAKLRVRITGPGSSKLSFATVSETACFVSSSSIRLLQNPYDCGRTKFVLM
ncbi:hypothetical protein ANCCAN_08243 [Ancylostoma caninum]|uniref:SAM domain-containing protein n=1 Tax=Ancylostoma caninum TaxID=29170 RepID=A0A368GMY9_ANCCA|nr:hypothetical protein ANCCAN_08243 [Ancylostoma caninum]